MKGRNEGNEQVFESLRSDTDRGYRLKECLKKLPKAASNLGYNEEQTQ
jgi:hypothetical protein